MNYRSNSDYEQYNQSVPWLKQKLSKATPVSPRSKMVANISNTSELHIKPTAMTVSPDGERKTCALENLENSFDDTNPFSNSIPHDTKLDEVNFLPSIPSKHEKSRNNNRRRTQIKDRRKAAKIILTQNLATARYKPKCAAVQTEPSMSLIYYPETIGDGRRLSQSCMDLTSSTTMEAIISENNLSNKQYLSENQRKFLSFLLMVILIFWLTSIILDVEIPSEFCRIALNYFWAFKSVIYYQEEPLTFIEKCWQYIQNILE